jgi:Asp-tRNA(Asn)/Glu-tRNA(Gln) amidotransferase A subunit family amidase
VERALRVTREDYLTAQVKVTDFIEEAAKTFAKYDLLTMPTVTVPAFSNKLPFGPNLVQGIKIDPALGWGHTSPFNMTGHPAISIPCGWTEDRKPLPIGLQIVGRRRADALVLRVAEAVERLLRDRTPERRPRWD